MKPFLAILLTGLIRGTAANAQEPVVVQSAEIVDYGIYRIERSGEKVSVPSAASGTAQVATQTVLIAETNQVPAIVGTTFGFQLVMKGSPAGSWVHIVIVTEHPAFKKPGGETTVTTDAVPWRYRIGVLTPCTYTFDHDWEAVPGPWKIEVWSNGTKLVGKEFVVKAEPSAVKADDAVKRNHLIRSETNSTSSAVGASH